MSSLDTAWGKNYAAGFDQDGALFGEHPDDDQTQSAIVPMQRQADEKFHAAGVVAAPAISPDGARIAVLSDFVQGQTRRSAQRVVENDEVAGRVRSSLSGVAVWWSGTAQHQRFAGQRIPIGGGGDAAAGAGNHDALDATCPQSADGSRQLADVPDVTGWRRWPPMKESAFASTNTLQRNNGGLRGLCVAGGRKRLDLDVMATTVKNHHGAYW